MGLASLLTAIAVLVSACGGTTVSQTPPAGAPVSSSEAVDLTGAGSSFAFPLYTKLFDVYHQQFGPRVNYQSIGSGGGIRLLQEKIIDFGGSDSIMSAQQQAKARGGHVLHIPTAAGAIAIAYNLPELANVRLRLTPDLLSGVYLKTIKRWNDPRIAAANPDSPLPARDIIVVHRSDGSGTTRIFTDYLSKVSQEWKERVGSGTSVKWPGDIAGQGNEGLANQVKQVPGSIGYVDLASASQNGLHTTLLQNRSGRFVEPSVDSASFAADVPDLPDNLEIFITNSSHVDAYPIVGFTWMLVYEDQTDRAQAVALARLAWWIIHDGQQYGPALDYVPIRGVAVAKAEILVKRIKFDGRAVLG